MEVYTKIKEDFISTEKKKYKYKIGKKEATSLAGFIVGFLLAFIVLAPFALRYCPVYLQNKGF